MFVHGFGHPLRYSAMDVSHGTRDVKTGEVPVPHPKAGRPNIEGSDNPGPGFRFTRSVSTDDPMGQRMTRWCQRMIRAVDGCGFQSIVSEWLCFQGI